MARTFGSIQFELAQFASANKLPAVDFELLRGWINDAYFGVLKSREWTGMQSDYSIPATGIYETGTVTLTNGSAVITGSGTTFTTAMTARKFRVPGQNEWYFFQYVSPTSGSLDRPYERDTVAGASFQIFQSHYSLVAGRARSIVGMRNIRTNNPIDLTTLEELDRMDPSRLAMGEPRYWRPSGDGPIYHVIELWPAPDVAMGVSYTYLNLPSEFDGTNTETELLSWVDPRVVIAGAKRLMQAHFERYTQSAFEKGIASDALQSMVQTEIDTVGPGRLRMASRYTRHRRHRGSRRCD